MNKKDSTIYKLVGITVGTAISALLAITASSTATAVVIGMGISSVARSLAE